MPKLDDKYLLPYVCNKVIDSISVKNNLEISLPGALLFADISGFTAMSEKLAGMGRVGGEKLAEIINDCFNPLLEIVFAWGGDVIKFGGDAILVLFEGDDKTGTALNCASELIRWVREHGKIKSPAGDFNLGIHAGISEGIIYSLIIGRIRKDHLFCGETVERAYAAADLADLGQIVLTRDAATIIRDIDIESINGEFVKISSAENLPDKEQSHPDRGRIEKRPARIDLDAFIDKRLMEQLYYNKGRIDGEHRIITSLFIGVNSLRNIIEKDPSGSIDTIQEYFETLNDIITRNGGSLARIDSGATSEKILVFFGAPRCFGNDAQNCLRAIIEIEAALKDLNENYRNPIEHRYGVNSGLCFVGDVGGAKRREYTAMGDAINLAARLMSRAAYGETLIGEETVRTCRAEFEFKDCGKIAVKGKSKPVKTCSLISEKQIRQLDTPMIGREREYERVRRYVNDIKERRPAALLISGEPGAGKSLLCLKLKSLATEIGINCFEGACFKQTEKAPYGPIKSILLELLDLSSNSPQKEKRAVLQKSLREIGEGEWETLMAPLLEYYPAVPPHLKNLPEETKKGKIESIIHRLIRESSRRNDTIIIIEDIQWIDTASYEIIESLLESGDLPGLLFVGRPGGICDELKKRYKIDEIELGALTEENSKKLFLSLFKEMKPNETIISNVIEKSGGNPFYLEEMAKAFMELGETRFESADNIPSGIESVITARIDNLGEMVKKTVRTASVIGRIFGYHVLKGIFPDRRRSKMLRDYLNELARLDLTPVERIQPALEYIFKHILTQEVAYNGLSFSARKSLHLKTAEYLSARKRLVKRTPETIARHFMLAGDLKRALPYLILSGKKASS
jgi:class 3 adenylate cyclase